MPHPPPGDLHDPGIEPVSCIAGGLFTSWATVFAFLVAKSPSQNSRKWNNLKIKSCETSASLGQIRCGVLCGTLYSVYFGVSGYSQLRFFSTMLVT